MNFLAKIRSALRYLTDPQISWKRKIWFYLIVLYFLSPLDFLPDIFPGIGWLDDLIVLSFGLWWFSRELERYRGWSGDRRSGSGQTIEAEYEVCPDEDQKKRDVPPKP